MDRVIGGNDGWNFADSLLAATDGAPWPLDRSDHTAKNRVIPGE
jgi:hypothetical protein